MKIKLPLAVAGSALWLPVVIDLLPISDHGLVPRVGVAIAQTLPLRPQAIAAAGVVEPYSEERDLGATANGAIVYVGAEEGAAVAAGQIVAEIDNADLKAALAAAQARVLIREQELLRLQAGAREEERRAAMATVKGAAAVLRLAKSNAVRRDRLAGEGIASAESIDEAHASVETAQAQYDLMTERLALLTAPPRAEDIAIASAHVELAKADVATLTAQIEKTRLRAPIDGIILQRAKTLGETVSVDPPTLVARIGDVSRLRVRAEINETDVDRVALGQPAYVTADAYGDRRFSGRVVKVGVRMGRKRVWSDAATEKSDTRILEVLIELDEDVRLVVGLRVDVMLEPGGQIANRATGHAG